MRITIVGLIANFGNVFIERLHCTNLFPYLNVFHVFNVFNSYLNVRYIYADFLQRD